MLRQVNLSDLSLLPSLFSERAEINRAYLLELNSQCLLQNFYLEAGIVMPGLQVVDDPSTALLHWGWEAPTCQLRGHFLGHWLSAAAMLIAVDADKALSAKLSAILDELDRCRILNGGEWIGPFPEKYFTKLERNEYIWSPQYTMHKLLMGLYHSYIYAGEEKALALLSHVAQWYLRWTERMERVNPHAVYSGEEGGMLEIWAGLYEHTKDDRYLTLAQRYCHPSIFRKLADGGDPLSNSHANASIPWAHGAAKMFEVTADEKWLHLTKAFWKCAVTDRDAYCTGGQNAGEFWIPPHLNGRFLGERNQEFCTVYNMVRLADYLFRFTGESQYADYIEKNLYNGFLAQQNRLTGMPTYFLPLRAGSRKKWGSKTRDFWCCHGTTVQAHTIYPSLCYYEQDDTLIVSQYIPSQYHHGNVTVRQTTDMKYYNDQAFFDETDDSQMSRWLIKLEIEAKGTPFTLALRVPDWLCGAPIVSLNGEPLNIVPDNGFLRIARTWENDTLRIFFPASVTLSRLPDRPNVAAVLEGPIVLAGLTNADRGLVLDPNHPERTLYATTEHTYSTFPWLQTTYTTIDQPENFRFVPLYDIVDEEYTVYFTLKS